MITARTNFARRIIVYVSVFALGIATALGGQETGRVLRSAREVRELSAEEAGRGGVAEFSGIVLGLAEPEGAALILQDATDSLYVIGASGIATGFSPGDVVFVRGRTDPGSFAPILRVQEVRKTGVAPLPEPERVTSDELFSAGLDARWIVVTGVVRDVRAVDASKAGHLAQPPTSPDTDPVTRERRMNLTLAIGERLLTVEFYGSSNATQLVDAEVEIRGICLNQHNFERQFLNPVLCVPEGVKISVLWRPPHTPFERPAISSGALYQFRREGISPHRVRVDGSVLHHEAGVGLWIRDGERGVFVQSEQTTPLEPGDQVHIAGFPARGPFSPILANAIYRRIDKGSAPSPVPLTRPADAIGQYGDLVVIQAVFEGLEPGAEGVRLRLNWAGIEVMAVGSKAAGALSDKKFEAGSLLSVTGLVMAQSREAPLHTGRLLPDTYNIVLRSAADVAVIRAAPWWTARRLALLFGMVAAALAALLAIVTIASRRRLGRERALRALQVSEYKARLADRNRMARELHDTIAQGLSAISLQLQLSNVPSATREKMTEHVAAAHKLVRTALSEVRSFIRNLRTQTQQDVPLATALKEMVQHAVNGSPIQAVFDLEGPVYRLSPEVEAQIIRITQEAVINAVRHSGAAVISVRLRHTPDNLTVLVEDDGRGFDTMIDWSRSGHWGLLGMKERASLINAKLSVSKSTPRGTRLHLWVPRRGTSKRSN